MDTIEAIQSRKSIRAFRSDPVPRSVLTKIMETALRAPSWSNTQPWQFAIVAGRQLEQIKQAFAEKSAEPYNPDLASPTEYPEPYVSRSRTLGRKVLEVKGIRREEKEKRRWWHLQGLSLFGAPSVIYLYVDRAFYTLNDKLNIWPIFDCGLVAENIMLMATNCGLGTTAQMQAVLYPDILRKILEIPDSKLMVMGIAIGYPDWDDPVNQFRSQREGLGNVARWYGFANEQ